MSGFDLYIFLEFWSKKTVYELRRHREGDHEFKTSLDYIANLRAA